MADNYDGNAEVEAILARLSPVAEGGIHETLLDGDDIPQDDMGQVATYISILFGESIPTGDDETMDRLGAQPFFLPFTLVIVAATADEVRRASAESKKLLVDWRPTATSDTVVPAGGSKTDLDSKNKPSRATRLAHYVVRINL